MLGPFKQPSDALGGQLDSNVPRSIRITSYILMAAALLLIMVVGLLPGLLAACLGFLLARGLNTWLLKFLLKLKFLKRRHGVGQLSWVGSFSTIFVIFAPLVIMALALTHYRPYIFTAPYQFSELTEYVARTVMQFRANLPEDLAAMVPKEVDELQRSVAVYLLTKAGVLANAGRMWLLGFLYAYVGLLIGALAANRSKVFLHAPLTDALRARVKRFGEAFRQIVAAQFWIASFNTALTAVFLLAVLPIFDHRLPFTPALITLTFLAGLIPIVGNLLCNVVITIVGLSVSPSIALACLVFLILIHKAEYFINAKVVGQKTHISVWELLSIMFVSEAVFGPAGLVAAPLFYAYLKKELEAVHLVR